jgi:GT2 family glycosyltransferase
MSENIYKLSVVIVNYKTPLLTIDCLASLLPELEHINAKVVIVDNASNDGSYEKIHQWIKLNDTFGCIDMIRSSDNTGFSGGNNLGINHVEAEYYLLLNSDTLVRKGAIRILLESANKDKSVGLVGPRLEWPDSTPQESCFKFHTAVSELIISATTSMVTKLLQSFVVAQAPQKELEYYDWESFACILIKKEVFKSVGLLDEGYFMYYEDVDFCFRAKEVGWKILNVPDSRVVHLRGGSSPVKSQSRLKKRLPRYYYESRTRYFYKRFGFFGLMMANIFWNLGNSIAILRSFFSSSFHTKASAYQWRDIWINFLDPLKPYVHPNSYD